MVAHWYCDSYARRVKSGENTGASRRADGSGGIGLREHHAAARQGFDVGRLTELAAVKRRVAPSQIVGEDEDYIRACGADSRRLRCGNTQPRGREELTARIRFHMLPRIVTRSTAV